MVENHAEPARVPDAVATTGVTTGVTTGGTAEEVAARHELVPLPVEGGLYRRTWAGPPDADGRPAGSAIIVLLTDAPGDFSALHRLPIDEVWHFYEGDALEVLLLAPDGADRLAVLGRDGRVQLVVPAGTWMGARVARGGGCGWSLFGTTMAPGFLPQDYEGGDAEELCARYPGRAAVIRELCRVGEPVRMAGLGGVGESGDVGEWGDVGGSGPVGESVAGVGSVAVGEPPGPVREEGATGGEGGGERDERDGGGGGR